MSTESVRIDSETLARIRKNIKGSGYTLSGYINTVLKKHMDDGDKWFEKLTGIQRPSKKLK